MSRTYESRPTLASEAANNRKRHSDSSPLTPAAAEIIPPAQVRDYPPPSPIQRNPLAGTELGTWIDGQDSGIAFGRIEGYRVGWKDGYAAALAELSSRVDAAIGRALDAEDLHQHKLNGVIAGIFSKAPSYKELSRRRKEPERAAQAAQQERERAQSLEQLHKRLGGAA